MVGGWVAVLSALVAWPATTELEGGANLDLRVGQAPTGIPTKSTPGVLAYEQNQLMLSATPLLGARWTDEANELRALSATRMLWRPLPFTDRRPIFLETLSATHAARPNRRTRWQLELRSTYGEEDYTSLVQQFGNNQPTLPNSLTMFTVNGIGDGAWQASRRTTLIVLASGTYRRSLSEIPQATGATAAGTPTFTGLPALPTETLVVITPGVRHLLDRRTSLELRAGIGDSNLEDLQLTSSTGSRTSTRANILTFQPEVGLIRDLTRAQQLRVFVGLTYAAVLRNPNQGENWRPWTPLFRAELSSQLWRTRASSLRSRLGAEASWYADPVLGIAVYRATALATLEAQLGLRWYASARASFTTDLNSPVWQGTYPLDETIAQVDVPFRYRWSTQLAVEFGARYAERAPNLWSSSFTWHYRELWAFVNLTGTTHRTRTAAPPTPRVATPPRS